MKQRNHYQQILRLVSHIGRLTNPQHLPVLKQMHLSLAQLLALDGLMESGGALRMSQLAQTAGLAESEVTRVVDELERKRWVERCADPDDGRVKVVRLTRAGARLIAEAYRQATAQLRGVWSDFTHEEWHRLIDYLRRFEAGLHRVRNERDVASLPARHRGQSTGTKGK